MHFQNTILLPSPRGAPLVKYKPPEIKKKPVVEKKPPKLEPWSDYDRNNLVENYLETLPWKLVKVLNTKRVLVVEVEDCRKKVKTEGITESKKVEEEKVKTEESVEIGRRRDSSVSTEGKPAHHRSGSELSKKSNHSNSKPPSKLSIFEELLEKTKPVNPVILGGNTNGGKSDDGKKEEVVKKEEVKPSYKPGPKSKKADNNTSDSAPKVVAAVDSPAAPVTVAPKPKSKPKIGPKSRVTRVPTPPPPTLTPTLIELPNAMEIKAKLLNSFREFQRLSKEKQESNSPPTLEMEIPSTDNILSKLRLVGSEDGSLIRFGLDINSKMARFWGMLVIL